MKARVETVCRDTGLSVRRACEVLEVNRSTLYRKASGGRPPAAQAVRDAEVVPVLQELAGRFPTYGYRRLRVLASRQMGRPVNGKRIRRLMQEHGLQTPQRVARARPRPHPRQVEATAPNQVWQMDFTKFLVGTTWVWLLVVMDRFSREVVGWTLSLRARATEARAALEAAFLERFPEGVRGRDLKVASDNGSAFLSEYFQAFARELEVGLLRTRVRYPEGNGRCERVIRTIKEEEVWLNEYATMDEARARLGEFLEFYNAERIHSALGYLSPRQYVALWRAGRLSSEAA